ncbi:MAG: flippase-like domain-containing protein, partial [Proteobacteria bacterium]|nr:flippase-like domain-containing protein [Pseudomonadota bacterium]
MKRLFLLLFIGVIAFALWFYYIDPKQTWDGIKTTNFLYLSLGYVLFFISYGFKILRWALILKKIKRIPFLEVVKYYWACEFVNNFVPARMGELSNSLLLKKNYAVTISASMSAVIVDRFYGIIVRLAVIGFIPFAAREMYPYLKNYLIYVVCLLAIILIFFILLVKSTRHLIKLLDKLLFFLSESWTQ